MELKEIILEIINSNIENEKKAEIIEAISKMQNKGKEIKYINMNESRGFNPNPPLKSMFGEVDDNTHQVKRSPKHSSGDSIEVFSENICLTSGSREE